MSDNTKETEHRENPDRPGWCAVCGCAYPCPGTVPDPPRPRADWLPAMWGRTYEGRGGGVSPHPSEQERAD